MCTYVCVVHVLKSHWSFAVQTCSEQHVQDADGSGDWEEGCVRGRL